MHLFHDACSRWKGAPSKSRMGKLRTLEEHASSMNEERGDQGKACTPRLGQGQMSHVGAG